jgi:hypothetical protein
MRVLAVVIGATGLLLLLAGVIVSVCASTAESEGNEDPVASKLMTATLCAGFALLVIGAALWFV